MLRMIKDLWDRFKRLTRDEDQALDEVADLVQERDEMVELYPLQAAEMHELYDARIADVCRHHGFRGQEEVVSWAEDGMLAACG